MENMVMHKKILSIGAIKTNHISQKEEITTNLTVTFVRSELINHFFTQNKGKDLFYLDANNYVRCNLEALTEQQVTLIEKYSFPETEGHNNDDKWDFFGNCIQEIVTKGHAKQRYKLARALTKDKTYHGLELAEQICAELKRELKQDLDFAQTRTNEALKLAEESKNDLSSNTSIEQTYSNSLKQYTNLELSIQRSKRNNELTQMLILKKQNTQKTNSHKKDLTILNNKLVAKKNTIQHTIDFLAHLKNSGLLEKITIYYNKKYQDIPKKATIYQLWQTTNSGQKFNEFSSQLNKEEKKIKEICEHLNFVQSNIDQFIQDLIDLNSHINKVLHQQKEQGIEVSLSSCNNQLVTINAG